MDNKGAIELADIAVSDALSRISEMGNVDIVNGELTAGGQVLNGSTALVDAIKARHGFGCTIFQANARVSTTAFAAGKNERALGTYANEEVTQLVYRLGHRYEGIARTIGKDWVIVYVPLRSQAGRIVGMLAAFREIDNFLGDLTLLDDTREAILLQTLDGRVRDANRAACDMLGLPKKDLIGKSMLDFSVDKTDVDVEATWPQLGDEPVESEHKCRAADGFEFVAKLLQSRIEHGSMIQGLTIARDFTEEYEARERLRAVNHQLQQANESLEDQVHDRTRSLQQTLEELRTTVQELTVTKAELGRYEARMISKYAMDKLRDPSTYKVAFTVGTLINLFGHFLVPTMRGRDEIWSNFVSELTDHPVLGVCSIAIAYLFPVLVQLHAAVDTRIKGRAIELLAEFPNTKPDPVFRAAPDGQITGAGLNTQTILNKYALKKAQDILGDALWDDILALQSKGERLPRETSVHVSPLRESFLVAHAPSSAGSVNVYLTAINPRQL